MDTAVTLEWRGDLSFEGRGRGGAPATIDGDGAHGPAPMETLLLALGGCTASDVVEIGRKMRQPLDGAKFTVRVEGDRAPEPPRRYTRVRLVYRVVGRGLSKEKLQHAVDLSQAKYCSVLHTLRPDLRFESELDVLSE